MCGRFTLTTNIATIAQAFQVAPTLQVEPRYNVAPTQQVVTVMQDETRHLELLRWGLIPAWAKDESIGNKMINARAETLAEKPSFKRLLTSKRCLVVADGFYEWKKEPGGKTPMYFTLKSKEPFAIAGLWDIWHTPDGTVLRTCTLITTQPNDLVSPVHDRMPAILLPDLREEWLNPANHDQELLRSFLKSYPTEEMTARPVSRKVNNVSNDTPELIA